jgi:hypothetical protein
LEKHSELRDVLQLHVYGGPLDSVSAHALSTSSARTCVQHFGRIERDPATGLSGREQILQRMRGADVLLLLHGEDAMCAEYIPSKLYEYLWMQRPIVALIHHNTQMLRLVRSQSHMAIATDHLEADQVALSLSDALFALITQWRSGGLADSGASSPYTTSEAVANLLRWAQEISIEQGNR